MTPITPDELVSLNRTMASLYEAAGRLVEVEKDRDHLAGILEKVASVFDDPDEGPEDFHQLPKVIEALVRENAEVKDAHHALWKRLQLVVRENETLARNMPPEPPDDPVFWNPYNGVVQDHRDGTVIQPDTDKERAKRGLPPFEMPESVLDTPFGAAGRVTKLLGQQWCRIKQGHIPITSAVLKHPGGWIALCDVHQDVQTGALTYRPLAVEGLPLAP